MPSPSSLHGPPGLSALRGADKFGSPLKTIQMTPMIELITRGHVAPTLSPHTYLQLSDRLWKTLQPELEMRITPSLALELMIWAAADAEYDYESPLQVAVANDNVEIATLLLKAGANPNEAWDDADSRPLQQAFENDLHEMMGLLLDHGPVSGVFLGGCGGRGGSC
ncbi:hypothetical protein B0H13DRAFT_2331779 [Mycena leptocephala]|nr:hypothetical protein B0H13DRAFT_2331779 [Mycena leptocephala]